MIISCLSNGKLLTIWVAFASLLTVAAARGQDVRDHDEGFTQPDQTVHLAAADVGVVGSFMVSEGSRVKRGEVICKLDTQVLEASLAVAKAKLNSRGRLDSAEATLRHRQNHLRQLEELRSQSHASDQEVIEARLNVTLANSALQAVLDEQAVAQAEVRHIEAQIERRIVRSSIDGVVLELPRRAGESISIHENHVATVAQLDRLRVRLFLSSRQSELLTTGSQQSLKFADTNRIAQAKVGFIAPVTDSNSGTVRVELLIDNSKGEYRSGVSCSLVNQSDSEGSKASVSAVNAKQSASQRTIVPTSRTVKSTGNK